MNEWKKRFKMIKERHKKTFETALKQGKMDEQMIQLCQYISKTKNYYTSSCCSGRIILLEKKGKRKIDTFFHRKWHRKINITELLEGIKENKEGELWLRLDPFILHIGCPTIKEAKKILAAMKKSGVKRGGITVAEKGKYLIELQGTNNFACIVKKNGKQLIPKKYFEYILEKLNTMITENYQRLEKLETEFKKTLE
jgi:tRNA wybutosine-synthesizing protein 3